MIVEQRWSPVGPALLFCPADRPERFAKAAAAADMVILDLEDGVAATDRVAARSALRDTQLDPGRTIVRVNAVGTPDHLPDLAAILAAGYHTVMLAKAESAQQCQELPVPHVIALCETPLGVLRAADIATAPRVAALMWGAEDLVATLGGSSSRRPDGGYRQVAQQARASVLLAAGAGGILAIDAVHLDIGDQAGLSEEATDAAASGFAATACIHPSQVPLIRAGYRPTDLQVRQSTELLEYARGQPGVFSYRGQMVDAPVLRHAERTVARAHAQTASMD